MTDHPAALILDRLAPGFKEDSECIFGQTETDALAEENAIRAGAAALRALAQFRPHHPAVVVSDVYAVFHVDHAAMMAARDVLGDHDLGPFDLKAAQAETARQRRAFYDAMTPDERAEKWGSR